jgi:hypothetical protein
MDGDYLFVDESGLVHYFCHHHAPEGSKKVEGTQEQSDTPKTLRIMKQESAFKKFLPLIVIFSVIILFTVFATYFHSIKMGGFQLDFAMRMMMGSFFLIFGGFKIFNVKKFAEAYATYDILAMRSKVYSFVYPFLELALAFLYLANIGGMYRDIFTFLIMGISAIGVIKKLHQKEEIPCACLGMVFKVPMTWVTLAEDLLMAVEALIMIFLTLN